MDRRRTCRRPPGRGGRAQQVAARLAVTAALLGPVLLSWQTPPPAAGADTAAGPAHASLFAANGKPAGVVSLAVEGNRLRIEVAASGLSPGFHGFHVHARGVCDPTATPPFDSAGRHLGSEFTVHASHAGDMVPLYARSDGTARARFTTDRFTLAQLLDGDGTALVVDAGPDNFANIPPRYKSPDALLNGPDAATLEAGDSGSRTACGVVAPGRAELPAGYFLVASDGGVFGYGEAVFRGGRGGQPLNRPIVGMATTPGGDGYFLVASDGGVFAHGDAVFAGGTGGMRLNAPVVGMATVPVEARASLLDTRGLTVGSVSLAEAGDTVRVAVSTRDLRPGFKGFHVHAKGVCDPDTDFSTTGGHLGTSSPGGPSHPGHAGDLPSLFADQQGNASASFRTDRFRLADLFDDDGAAFVIDSGADDFANIPDRYSTGGQPGPDQTTKDTGDAGPPAECGVVRGSNSTKDSKGAKPAAGYWLVAADGGIFNYGDAPYVGSAGAIKLSRPVVGMAPTPTGDGYWLVAADGGIFNYGDAPFLGSTGAMKLNKAVVGLAATPTGRGYWLVAADGGIFNYGDAPFLGSTGGMKINSPIVGLAATATGAGYWLFAADGGVFAFGDATFVGSAGAIRLNRPIVAAAAL